MKHYKRKKKMHLKQAVSFALAAMLALETPITSVSATEITPQEAQKESAEVSTAEISQEQQSNEMAAIAETGTNLIKNGGFETSSGKEFKINPGDISKADLPINDWTYYTTTNTSYRLEKEENGYIEIDDNEKKEGNQSIHFKAIDNTGAAYNKIFGIIANNNSLTKDKYYKYSMWIKTANMKPGQGWKKGFFWKFKHNNGKDYLCNLTSTDLPENEGFDIKDGNAIHENTDGWVYYEVILPKSVGSTLETTLIMEMVTGDVWVDDVRLEEVDCTLNTSVLTLDLENNTSAELNVLEKCGITAEQAKTAEWSADNTDVVELSEKNETGAVTVTALKSGSAIVTATLSDGKTATCIVTVEGEAEPDIPTETEHNLVLSANELSLEKMKKEQSALQKKIQ